MGSGSNHDPFITLVGASSLDVSYWSDDQTGMHLYPLYHSIYDSFYSVDTFLDPGYKVTSSKKRISIFRAYLNNSSSVRLCGLDNRAL